MRKENNGRRSFENRSAQCSFTGISGKEVEPWNSQGIAETGRELRKPSMSNELKPFIWDDYVYNQALRGNGAEHFNRTWTSSTERIALTNLITICYRICRLVS